MRRFEFPLEKVLEVRQIKRLVAEEKLAEALREEDRARDSLEAVLDEQEAANEKFRSFLLGTLDPVRLRSMVRYGESLEKEIFRTKADLREKEEITGAARFEAIDRTKDEEALIIHKEEMYREHKAAFWWEQGKALDEIGSQRYLRAKAR